MRKSVIFFILPFIFIACKSSQNVFFSRNASGFNEIIKIDVTNISPINEGIFEGWGSSLCWWGNRIGGNEKMSDEAAKLFYSLDKGIGLNIVRYNIGGGDDPSHNHIKRSDSAMPGFLVYDEEQKKFVYDWNADKRQRKVLSKIISENQDVIVEFFSNSPPYCMTYSGCSSGAKYGYSDNLREECYQDFAEYLAEVTYNLINLDGISVRSLEPLNEPMACWPAFSEKQEGCHVSMSKQSPIIELTRQALDKKGLKNVIVSCSDESGSGTAWDSFYSLTSEAKNSVARINTHTYWYPRYKALQRLAVKNDKNLWVSETDDPVCVGYDNGEMGPALGLGRKIITDMNGLKPSAWVLWQVISGYDCLEEFNGVIDGYNHENFAGSCWGTASGDFIHERILLSKKYYGYGQFTKFIRPGSYVVYIENENYIAAYDKAKKQVAIVCLNPEQMNKTCLFDLSTFANGWKSIKSIRTSGKTLDEGENLAEAECFINEMNGNSFSAELIPNSITTFVISDIELL